MPALLGHHDIFEPMNGPVARIADAVAILLELEDMLTVEKYSALRPMRHVVLESWKGLTEWSTQVGGSLAGDDVAAEVVPGVRDPSRKTAWQKLGEIGSTSKEKAASSRVWTSLGALIYPEAVAALRVEIAYSSASTD